jgi:hypothetical protein
MEIKSLTLTQFRAFEQATFEFQPGMNLLVGINGVGKSSVLDALRIALSRVLPQFTAYQDRRINFEVDDIMTGRDQLAIELKFQTFDTPFICNVTRGKSHKVELKLLPNSHNIFSDGKTNAKVTHILLSFYPHGYDNNLNQVPDYIMEYKDTDVDINREGYNWIATLEGKCVSCNYPSLYYSFFDLDWIVRNDPNRESVAEGIIQFEGNNGNILRFGHEMKEDGYTVLSQIDSFVTNLFLFFQTQQNKEVTYVESKGFGQSKIKKSKQLSLRSYIKLDVDNKTRVIKRQSTTGKHESPITHWRRGHWRNQPCGEKLQDSKIIWIQPTLINPTQE